MPIQGVGLAGHVPLAGGVDAAQATGSGPARRHRCRSPAAARRAPAARATTLRDQAQRGEQAGARPRPGDHRGPLGGCRCVTCGRPAGGGVASPRGGLGVFGGGRTTVGAAALFGASAAVVTVSSVARSAGGDETAAVVVSSGLASCCRQDRSGQPSSRRIRYRTGEGRSEPSRQHLLPDYRGCHRHLPRTSPTETPHGETGTRPPSLPRTCTEGRLRRWRPTSLARRITWSTMP